MTTLRLFSPLSFSRRGHRRDEFCSFSAVWDHVWARSNHIIYFVQTFHVRAWLKIFVGLKKYDV